MKTESLIRKIVNRYIGVDQGYLGMPTCIRFSYRNHEDFYPEYCDLSKSPSNHEGTTRKMGSATVYVVDKTVTGFTLSGY